MRWIVGIDLRPRSHGAIAYGAWLHEHATEGNEHDLVGVHVLEERDFSQAMGHLSTEEISRMATETAGEVLERANAAHIEDIRMVWGKSAEQTLADARQREDADGLIVGRAAATHGRRLVRLGRVARRLVRRLPAPIIVVPPDLDPATLTGPIIATTDLSDDSLAACRFAARMAASLSRKLIVVHGVPIPEDYGAHYIPAETLEKLRVEHQETGEKELAAWTTAAGIRGHEERVLQGRVTEHVLELADTLCPALIATGSRHLSIAERLLLASMGTELAGHSPWPVAVVAADVAG